MVVIIIVQVILLAISISFSAYCSAEGNSSGDLIVDIVQVRPESKFSQDKIQNQTEPNDRSADGRQQRLGSLRTSLSQRYVGSVKALDNFLAGRNSGNRVNESYIKFVYGLTQYKNQSYETDSKFKLRIDLPNTEERLRIYFDSEPPDADSIINDVRSVSSGQKINDNGSTAGVELFVDSEKEKLFKSSLSLGARFYSGVRSHVRYRIRNRETFIDNWQVFFRQDLWHVSAVGWGANNRIEFRNRISSNLTFSAISRTDIREFSGPATFGQTWNLNHLLSDQRSTHYKFGHVSENRSGPFFDRHFFNISFRKNIYEGWLFASVTPEIAYIKGEKERTEFSLSAKIELFFTD